MFIGLTPEGLLMELFGGEDGTWTMIYTFPFEGELMSCLVTHGEGFETLIQPEPEGDPA